MAIFDPESGPDAKPEAAWVSVFKRLDADADGKLSFAEWQKSPKALANPGKLESIFAGLDKDGDKAISRDEFAAQ